jgi:hypothetical protein
MPIPINIPYVISIAKIAGFLAGNEQTNFAKNPGGTIMPYLSRHIYIVRKSVEWQYNIDPEADGLQYTTAYLQELIGRYLLIAQGTLGQSGGIVIIPPSGAQFGIVGVQTSFTIGDINSPMSVNDTTIVFSYNNPIFNTDTVFRDNTVMQKNLSDRASYTSTYTSTNLTIVFNVPVMFGETYEINFLRYTNT